MYFTFLNSFKKNRNDIYIHHCRPLYYKARKPHAVCHFGGERERETLLMLLTSTALLASRPWYWK